MFNVQVVGLVNVPKAITGVGFTVTTVPALAADEHPEAFVTITVYVTAAVAEFV
ncbi:MAG: hypothetical protein ACK46Y_12695 [Fluviicola sp.]